MNTLNVTNRCLGLRTYSQLTAHGPGGINVIHKSIHACLIPSDQTLEKLDTTRSAMSCEWTKEGGEWTIEGGEWTIEGVSAFVVIVRRAQDMGYQGPAEALVRCVQAKGAAYAVSLPEELATTQRVALATGVVMDPVYSGKALHGLLQ
eukprot:1051924-Pyramimonas_sp.AAC.1